MMQKLILNKDDLKIMYKLVNDIVKKSKKKCFRNIFIDDSGMIGADETRLGKYSKITFDKKITIPVEVIKAIKILIPDSIEIELINDLVEITLKDNLSQTIFSIVFKYQNPYQINFKNIELKKYNCSEIFEIEADELKHSITYLSKKSSTCIFEIKSREVELVAIDDNNNEIERININSTKSTSSIKIAFEINYILDYLKNLKNEAIKMYFINSSSLVCFEECENIYEYILMPVALV